MSEQVQGIKRFLLYRIKGRAGDAVKIALQTEHEATSDRESTATATKDGTKRSSGQIEQEVSATTLLSSDGQVNDLKEAQEQDEIVELWDVNHIRNEETEKYPATYYQTSVTSVGETAPSDAGVEVSLTFSVEEYGKRGETALNEAQEEVLQYAFTEAVEQPADQTEEPTDETEEPAGV